ncbi:MAG: hypothetical protein JEZ00_01805 [Anaerolineaceae bacterium]|nr:hypothetical protein [Anaerolineaceae bacterium]
MSGNPRKSSIQNQLYLYFSEDGLVDLAIGMLIFSFAAMLLIGLPALSGIISMLPFFVWYLGKQTLTIPRVGIIKPAAKMKNRFVVFFLVLLALGIGVFLLYFLSARSSGAFLLEHPLALFGLILAVGISILGLVLKTTRFYYYAVLVFVSMTLGEILNPSSQGLDMFLIAVLVSGSVIILSGSIVLIKFLRKYPVIKMEG